MMGHWRSDQYMPLPLNNTFNNDVLAEILLHLDNPVTGITDPDLVDYNIDFGSLLFANIYLKRTAKIRR